MSLSLSSLPPGFSWLRAAYRPTRREVRAYAQIIAEAEGVPSAHEAARLHNEAELQLWAWRTETRQRRGFSRRIPPSGSAFAM